MTAPLVAFLAVLVAIGVAWSRFLRRWARTHPAVPPRPETLRRAMEHRKPLPPLAGALYLGMKLAILAAGVLLVVLADDPDGRTTGGAIVAFAVLPTAYGTWYARTGRLDAARQRALTESEAFWSQPDAEARARAMRKGPLGRAKIETT